jgi:hypothetical protein
MPALRLTPVTAFEFNPTGKVEAEKAVMKLRERGVHARIGDVFRGGVPILFSVVVPDLELNNARRVLGIELQAGSVSCDNLDATNTRTIQDVRNHPTT